MSVTQITAANILAPLSTQDLTQRDLAEMQLMVMRAILFVVCQAADIDPTEAIESACSEES